MGGRERLERRLTIAAFIVSTTASIMSLYAAIHLGLARYFFMGLLWGVPSFFTARSLLSRRR